MKRVLVRKDSYYDSVFLMLATRELEAGKGVRGAIVAMGTPMNLDLLRGLGYEPGELSGAGPGDLVAAVDAEDAAAADAALAAALDLVTKGKAGGAARASTGASGAYTRAATSRSAAVALPDANIALISVPGAYAAREARLALERGLHVMLFSDNVSLEDEIALKTLAVSKGLLMMGPDCGTAIIGGKPLCFANAVARGPVGVVAAAGTGLQEVTCLLDRHGSGVSQAIGVGGRDLKNAAVGGRMSLFAIQALARDPATSLILVIGKPPAPEVAREVLSALRESGKPAVVHFLGTLERPADEARIFHAANLEEAARLAAALSPRAAAGSLGAFAVAARAALAVEAAAGLHELAAAEAARLAPAQRYVRGLYTGGTLADEALFLMDGPLGGVRSNLREKLALADPRVSEGHSIVDLGDDFFTVGKPHPMIDPSQRCERIRAEGRDPEAAVLLLDLVIGTGSHADPAGEAAAAIADAKAEAAARGGYLAVVASLTGTIGDAQGFAQQKAKLEAAGALVMESNYRACLLALEITRLAAAKGGAK